MRKPWRWVLGSVAAFFALFALFVWDAIRRAEAAIDAHERKLLLDIAALRAEHARVIPLLGKIGPKSEYRRRSSDDLEKLERMVSSELFFDYETPDLWGDYHFLYFIARSSSLSEPPSLSSPAAVMENLAFPHDWLRGGGVSRAGSRNAFQRLAIGDWKAILENEALDPASLRSVALFVDRVSRSRPPVRQALEGERIMDKLRVIRVLRTRSDEHRALAGKPDWRSLFLWRIFIARTLSALDRMYRDFEAFDSLPTWSQASASLRYHDELKGSSRFPATHYWGKPVPEFYRANAEFLEHLSLMRIATAIARYKVEHGCYPPDLDALAPHYLERVPVNPATGEPFSYSNGSLAASKQSEEPDVWWIGRKGPSKESTRDP